MLSLLHLKICFRIYLKKQAAGTEVAEVFKAKLRGRFAPLLIKAIEVKEEISKELTTTLNTSRRETPTKILGRLQPKKKPCVTTLMWHPERWVKKEHELYIWLLIERPIRASRTSGGSSGFSTKRLEPEHAGPEHLAWLRNIAPTDKCHFPVWPKGCGLETTMRQTPHLKVWHHHEQSLTTWSCCGGCRVAAQESSAGKRLAHLAIQRTGMGQEP